MTEEKLAKVKSTLEELGPRARSLVILVMDYEGVASIAAEANLADQVYLAATLGAFNSEILAGRPPTAAKPTLVPAE